MLDLRCASISLGLALLFCHSAAYSVQGTIHDPHGILVQGDVVQVSLFPHQNYSGRVQPLSKRDLYQIDVPIDAVKYRTQVVWKDLRTEAFSVDVLAEGAYTVAAWKGVSPDGSLSFEEAQPLGWGVDFTDCIGHNSGDDICSNPVTVNETIQHAVSVPITIRQSTHFPSEAKTEKHGHFDILNGVPRLVLWGSAKQRGYAHGFLLGPQIVDMVELFLLEDRVRSPMSLYDGVFVPRLKKYYNISSAFMEECEGIVQGIHASGTDMTLSYLGRNLTVWDIVALNAYGDYGMLVSAPSVDASMCTQFSFWGDATAGTDVDGGLIAGRNMDGEIDSRKVTVTHFVMFAVHPAEMNTRRYVHFMWPGFVGVSSAVNEDGHFLMENFGCSPPNAVMSDGQPLLREMLRDTIMYSDVPVTATATDVSEYYARFRAPSGGSCVNGCILFFAQAYNESFTQGQSPSFVYEGDRFGGEMRLPSFVRPASPNMVMASNHYWQYHYNPLQPSVCNGQNASFSSLWRYEAGKNKVEAYDATGERVGTDEMHSLLQTVSHSTTEHSVVWRANQRTFDVAIANKLADGWQAPYLQWHTFAFDDVFVVHDASMLLQTNRQ